MPTPTLPYDPATATAHLAAADPVMASLIAAMPPFTLALEASDSPFTELSRSIVYQQLAGAAARAIYNRLLDLAPDRLLTPALLPHLDDATLRTAGLSFNKIRALRDLAAKTLDGTVPPLAALHDLPDDAIITRLTSVRGIGVWTAQMLLLFHLGRPDVLPVDDLGVRRGYWVTYGGDALPTRSALRAAAEPWRPYRSVASWYLWRASDAATGRRVDPLPASDERTPAPQRKRARPRPS